MNVCYMYMNMHMCKNYIYNHNTLIITYLLILLNTVHEHNGQHTHNIPILKITYLLDVSLFTTMYSQLYTAYVMIFII